ncbi:MAG: DUF2961 domain-containing protein [Verrucomicrobia bacterium]|nr:DUF2961 domain-containing protein [Verrucomicrobiota bacterium]
MKHRVCLVFSWLTASGVLWSGWAAPIGLEALYRLDRLPAFKTSVKIGSVSSYDRSGGNDDGFSGKYSFVRRDEQGVVLADLQGPGVIYRLWTPTPTEDIIEFLFDGETEPRVAVKYRDLFLGKHPAFPRPLVGFGAGGYYSYVPLPYARSCVVRVRAPKVQFYQINYATYDPAENIRSWSATPDALSQQQRQQTIDLWHRTGRDLSQFTAHPRILIQSHHQTVRLAPHSSAQVFHQAKGGGRIVGLQLWPASQIASKARDLLLKISYDGDEPAVLAPLGDFFGYAWGQPAVQSLLVGTTGETNYCYFPMPFQRSVTVELVSERNEPVELGAQISVAALPLQPNEGKFYALWHRENPTRSGQPFTFIDTAGRGHLVGVILQSQGFESGKTHFFEGDDQTTIDGELVVHGTGSEDFFNGGWYDVPDRWEKRLSFPLSGCLGYAKHLGRTGGYRLFLGDAYAYRQSLLQTIEHAPANNLLPTDYVSVTYLYSEPRPTASLTVPPLSERAVVDLNELIFPAGWQTPIYAWSFERATLTRKKERIGQEEVRFLSLTATESDWFGPHFLSPVCEVPAAGPYAIYIEAMKGPAQAHVQLFQNENPVAPSADLYAPEMAPSGRLFLGQLDLAAGHNNLMFKLVGKHPDASGLGLDLILIICVRVQPNAATPP